MPPFRMFETLVRQGFKFLILNFEFRVAVLVSGLCFYFIGFHCIGFPVRGYLKRCEAVRSEPICKANSGVLGCAA